jgi:DUF4097 and DUF4098 domain-containing protein YvlB
VNEVSIHKRRPSLIGALLWIGLGLIFLLDNLGVGPDFWSVASRYWPVLLIMLGLGKVIDYYRGLEGISVSVGEILAIILLLFIGTALTRISTSRFREVLRDLPVRIGGNSLPLGQWIGNSYTYIQEKTYPFTPSTALHIENSYGLVSVTPGADNEVHVLLRKVVYQDDEAEARRIADQIGLEADPQGTAEADTLTISTNRAKLAGREYRFNTDMEVQVPLGCQIQIRNSFGEVKATDLKGKLDLHTSYRPLEVRNSSGDFIIDSRFSESRLINLTGNVRVRARGRVELDTVKGDVVVRNEYSPVKISNVDGTVNVENIQSNIDLENISKSVTVNAPGTQLTAHNLSDSLKAVTSHREAEISKVASNVVLESRYGTVTLRDIKGNLDITSDSDRIVAGDIGGSFKVKARGTGIALDGARGPLDIETSLRDVVVDDFRDSCRITNQYADVRLSGSGLGEKEAIVRTRNGSIDLFIPERASFLIDATAKNGEVRNDYRGLSIENPGAVGSLRGRSGSGGARIELETQYGNIRIRERSVEEPRAERED